MNPKPRRFRLYLAGSLAGLLTVGLIALAFAASEPAQGKPQDYQRYDLTRPWFDGLPWDWFLDMFNQPSVKPQQEGTIQQFPLDSVPRTGVEPFIAADAKIGNQLARDVMPKNPVPTSAASVANGKIVFETYCGVCHGNNGMGSALLAKGMPAPPIGPLLPALSEAHLYNKALYGGPLMPAYGYQTSAKERWDAVNYMKSPQFGK